MSLPSPRLPLRHPACWLWVLLLSWFMGGMLPSASGSPRPDGGQFDSQRATTLKYNLSNGRGDIVAQSNAVGELTWTASYEAYGKRTKETGANADKQRANSKDEDPTGLLNEGFRYRDLETGVWLSRDPAGFVDGPNLYAYVRQNPWSRFDPDGLNDAAFFQDEFAAQTPEVQAAMREFDRKVFKGIANTPRALKDGIQNIPKLPGQLIDAAKNPAHTLENIKQAANETLHDPEKLGEFAGTLYAGGALSKLSRARAATSAAGATATKAVTETAKDVAEDAMKTVGRHMSPDELVKMKKTGRVQEGGGGQTRVSDPANPDTYKAAPKGDVYVEFDVPADRVLPHSQGTGRIPGPGSPDARVPGKNPADFEMPEAKNIKEPKPKPSDDK